MMGFWSSSSELPAALLFVLFLVPCLSSFSVGDRNGIDFHASTAALTLLGDAHLTNRGEISLTLSNQTWSSGRALYAHPVYFLDTSTNSPASFLSSFSFTILPSSPLSSFGDGFAFVITSNSRRVGSDQGYMGLLSSNTNCDSSSEEEGEEIIALEFDTSMNLPLGDINDNHVGLDVNTIFSLASAGADEVGIDLRGGKPATAWIEYKNKLIQVWISYSHFRPHVPLLATHIDLSKYYKEFMYVGFSASNGKGMALHLIDRWSFRTFGFQPLSGQEGSSPVENPHPVNNDNDGVNGDGLVPEETRNKRKKELVGFRLGAVAAVLFSMMAIASAGWYFVRKMRRTGEVGVAREESFNIPARVSLAEIKSATRGFHCSRIIGQGATGTVYQGLMSYGNAIAVKRFGRMDRFTNTFATELAAMVGCLRHKNLIQLQGWCCEKDELILVYEHMPNGSLDKVLHTPSSPQNSSLLSWEIRLNIVLGVASALSYLHEECEKQIIHRDVKASNIMLDAEFNAKLGDFGLAELKEHDGSPKVTLPAGTMGYLAPEYVHTGIPSKKTDVYSFGVVTLEVATGRRPIEMEGFVLVDWIWGMWSKGKLVGAADPQLGGRFNKEEMYRMLVVGLSCVHPDPDHRADVTHAMRMLKGEAPLPFLPHHKPSIRLCSLIPSREDTGHLISSSSSS